MCQEHIDWDGEPEGAQEALPFTQTPISDLTLEMTDHSRAIQFIFRIAGILVNN